MRYRTYDTHWNRTGHSDAPQYSGQAGVTDDYPAKCHCGSEMHGCGDAVWLRFCRAIGRYTIPDWVAGRTDYVAWCANGHELSRAPV